MEKHFSQQIQKILPRSAWQKVVIRENNEPLVLVPESKKLIYGNEKDDRYKPLYCVRQSVAEKLIKVSISLPEDLKLVLIEGYRTLEMQKAEFEKELAKTKRSFPELPQDQLEQKTSLIIARPNPLANHHCGGAVDVTLAYTYGTRLDMGTPYASPEHSQGVKEKYFMFTDRGISDIQKANRSTLREAMESEGFIWYPGEWWHYCWGDRMWAVYTNRKECCYGSAKLRKNTQTVVC